jgi:hypothetical protein
LRRRGEELGWLLRLLAKYATLPMLIAVTVAELPARIGDRRLLDLVVAVVAAEFHGSLLEGVCRILRSAMTWGCSTENTVMLEMKERLLR